MFYCPKKFFWPIQGASSRPGDAPGAQPRVRPPDKDLKADSFAPIIEKFLKYSAKMMELLHSIFEDHMLFKRAMRESFAVVFNTPVANFPVPQLLAIYADKLLTGKIKAEGDAVDNILRRCHEDIFALLRDKDVFVQFYTEYLAQRLLMQRAINDDAERAMVARLKMTEGVQFTQKIEVMLKDMDIAKDTDFSPNALLSRRLAGRPEGPVPSALNLNVTVLTEGVWPHQVDTSPILPRFMSEAMNLRNEVYREINPSKVLRWIYSRGTVEINISIPGTSRPANYTLIGSTLQGVVLNLFDGLWGPFTMRDIAARTGIKPDHLPPLLMALIDIKLLLKSGALKKFGPEDTYELNPRFQYRLRRIILPSVQLRDVDRAVRSDINAMRDFTIDAAAVRIMKSRRRMGHNELMAEIMHQVTTCKPDTRLIRNRIENLIDKEYIARDSSDRSLYVYLA